MTEDWKWVLRTSPATRSIVRYLPESPKRTTDTEHTSRVFTNTRAMFSISGGDSSVLDLDSASSDLGTGFALSTNVVGNNRLQVGGAYSADGMGASPGAMSLTALYTRNPDSTFGPLAPEVAFTVSQFSVLPGQSAGGEAAISAPPVRTMSISVYQAMDVADSVHLEYGMTGESVEYLQHTARVSPFARVTLSAGAAGQLIGSFSDGDRPEELLRHQPRHEDVDELDYTGTLPSAASLASVPQVSYRDGHLELQRTHTFELGYQLTGGSRTYSFSAFTENVTNGRVHVAGDLSTLSAGDLLSDGVSNTSVYNIGAYRRNGALLSIDQHLGDSADFSLAYGRMGGLMPNASGNWDGTPGSLLLNERDHNVASANLSARVPKAGTHLFASYGWADRDAVLPAHVFTTQNSYVSPGLNLMLKQPLPSIFGMPGRLLFTADIRNLLAQGYIPVSTPDGQSVMLVQAPRTLRGGLNFIF